LSLKRLSWFILFDPLVNCIWLIGFEVGRYYHMAAIQLFY